MTRKHELGGEGGLHLGRENGIFTAMEPWEDIVHSRINKISMTLHFRWGNKWGLNLERAYVGS